MGVELELCYRLTDKTPGNRTVCPGGGKSDVIRHRSSSSGLVDQAGEEQRGAEPADAG